MSRQSDKTSHKSEKERLLAEIGRATRALPPLLQSTSPDGLATKLLPVLTKPWPAACEAAAQAGGAFSMRSPYLPLLQQEQLVTCQHCKRVLVIECFEAHQATASAIEPGCWQLAAASALNSPLTTHHPLPPTTTRSPPTTRDPPHAPRHPSPATRHPPPTTHNLLRHPPPDHSLSPHRRRVAPLIFPRC